MKNFRRIIILIGTALVIPSIVSYPARAESVFNVCNQSNFVAYVALAYDLGNRRWSSQGWWKIPNNECRAIQPENLAPLNLDEDNYFYLYASDENEIRVWQSNNKKFQFCVNPDEDFYIEFERNNCSNSETPKRIFWELKVRKLSETFILKTNKTEFK